MSDKSKGYLGHIGRTFVRIRAEVEERDRTLYIHGATAFKFVLQLLRSNKGPDGIIWSGGIPLTSFYTFSQGRRANGTYARAIDCRIMGRTVAGACATQ